MGNNNVLGVPANIRGKFGAKERIQFEGRWASH